MSSPSYTDMISLYNAVMDSAKVKNLLEENKKLKREVRSLKNILYSIPEFRCGCSNKPRKVSKLRSTPVVEIKQEKISVPNVVDLTKEMDPVEAAVESVEVEEEVEEEVKVEVEEEEEEVEEEEEEEEQEEEVKVEEEQESVEEEEEEEEVEETKMDIVEEENVQMKISEQVEVEAEEEEEEEAEVFEIEFGGVTYYTDDEVNGSFYAKTADDDIGDELGVFVNGKPKFHKK
jgi:chemotaxis protein histidine kinase CheA